MDLLRSCRYWRWNTLKELFQVADDNVDILGCFSWILILRAPGHMMEYIHTDYSYQYIVHGST